MKPTLQGMDEKGINFAVAMQPQPVNIYFSPIMDILSVAQMHLLYIQSQ